MKKKHILFPCLVLVLLLCSSGIRDIMSSGAPVGSTGAANEQTCGKAGCHTGENNENNINTGEGILSVIHNIESEGFTPGAVYSFTVSLNENEINRFGYSLTILNEYDNKAGQFIVTDSIRTQCLPGNLQYTGREYMTYRMPGTVPVETNLGKWTFKWKAPDTAVQFVKIFVAAVSANDDATDYGDLVYTNSYIVSAKTTNLKKHVNDDVNFICYPNPASSYFMIKPENIHFPCSIRIFSSSGDLLLDKQVYDAQDLKMPFNIEDLSNGIYSVRVSYQNIVKIKPLIVKK